MDKLEYVNSLDLENLDGKELENLASYLCEGTEGILTKSRMQTIRHNEVYNAYIGSGGNEEDELHAAFSNVAYLLHPHKKVRAKKRKIKETKAEKELREMAEAEADPIISRNLWKNYWNSEINHTYRRAGSVAHPNFYSNASLCCHYNDGDNLQLNAVTIKELLKMDLDDLRDTEVGRQLEEIVKKQCSKKQRTAFYARLVGYKNKEIEGLGIGWSVKTVDHFFNQRLPKIVEQTLKRRKEETIKGDSLVKICSCCGRQLPYDAFYKQPKGICKECKRKRSKEARDNGKQNKK